MNSNEKEFLDEFVTLNQIYHENDTVSVYARAKINQQVFTSEIYGKQKKRSNFIVSWNEYRNFGLIRFFIVTENDTVYAFIQEYTKNLVAPEYISPKIRISALRPESTNFLAAARNEVAAFRRRRAEK